MVENACVLFTPSRATYNHGLSLLYSTANPVSNDLLWPKSSDNFQFHGIGAWAIAPSRFLSSRPPARPGFTSVTTPEAIVSGGFIYPWCRFSPIQTAFLRVPFIFRPGL